jgi:hypothetical protein
MSINDAAVHCTECRIFTCGMKNEACHHQNTGDDARNSTPTDSDRREEFADI